MVQPTATDTALTIAKRITGLRLKKAWTRETLAEKSGVNMHTLKHFERTGKISLDRLVKICDALDLQHEIERLFKPRQRVNIESWTARPSSAQRKRGRRRDAVQAEHI